MSTLLILLILLKRFRHWARVERGAGLNHRGFGDVDAVRARALTAGPREDARVLGLVPQVGLENAQALERREVLGEETPLIVRVVTRGSGPREVGKALANAGPEIPVRGPRQGCSLRAVQFHVPSANDNRRRSPLPITSPAIVGASAA